MPDHPNQCPHIRREPLLAQIFVPGPRPLKPYVEGTSAKNAKPCDFLTQ
jgi:hypothetical protein